MTAVLEPESPEMVVDERAIAPSSRRDDAAPRISLGLAACALGAAVIHFGMVPSHSASSTVEAVGFAIAGWIGVVVGLAALLRPTRTVATAAVVSHALFIALWLWSRTVGLPVGGHSGHPAEFTGIDITANVMAAAVVLLGLGALGIPLFSALRGVGRSAAVGGLIAGAAMVATSVALASPSARNHSDVAHGDHASAGTDAAATGGAAAIEGDGHDHSSDVAATDDGSTVAGSGSAAISSDGVTGSGGDDGGAAATGDASSATHDHSTGGSADVVPSALASRCDLAFNPVAFWQETNVVHNGAASAATTGSAGLDALIAATTKAGGETKDAEVVVRLSQASEADYTAWLNWLPNYVGHDHTATAAPDDNAGHGGHLGPQPWTAMTDQAECDQLASELDRAREVALRYPTAADAQAAGWTRVTGYVPGIAAHFMNFGYVDGVFDIDKPEMLLYDGDEPTSNMVGLSYYLIHESDFEPTQGFTGPNDHFHRHVGLCVDQTGVIGDTSLTDEECAARGGVKSGGSGGWMNHVWIVPGCESPWGMFSGASPTLDRVLGEASGTDGGACAGTGVADRYDLTPGSADNVPATLVGSDA